MHQLNEETAKLEECCSYEKKLRMRYERGHASSLMKDLVRLKAIADYAIIPRLFSRQG
jgi:hypothetical protein